MGPEVHDRRRPGSRSLSALREGGLDPSAYRRELAYHDAPHEVGVDVGVVADELVSHAGDLTPRDIGYASVTAGRKAFHGLRDDREVSDDVLRLAVGQEAFTTRNGVGRDGSIESRTCRR
jgi:hypothetical protein